MRGNRPVNKSVNGVGHAKRAEVISCRSTLSFWCPHTYLQRWERSAIDDIIKVTEKCVNSNFREQPPRRVWNPIRTRSRIFRVQKCRVEGTAGWNGNVLPRIAVAIFL